MAGEHDDTGSPKTADAPEDHRGSAGSDPSGHGGVRSRSSIGSAGYGGQPGMGGYEQGFDRRRSPAGAALPAGIATSSTDSGDGGEVSAGRIVRDPGSVDPPSTP